MSLELSLQIIIVILGFYIAFFKKYFEKKGENLATKEDIADITSRVESVKTEFVKEIEQLKIKLQFENTVKAAIYNDRKEAIIKLYEAVHVWYQIIERHIISGIEYDKDQLKDAESQMEKAEFRFEVAESRVELYVHDDTYLELVDNYHKHIFSLQNEAIDLLLDYDEIDGKFLSTDVNSWNKKKDLHNQCDRRCRAIHANINAVWITFRKRSFDLITSV